MKSIYYYNTIIGELGIVSDEHYIYEIIFGKRDYVVYETKLMKECYKQLEEYFDGNRKTFDLPLFLEGTEFQKRVWQVLLKIPYGKTVSYKDIAIFLGNKNMTRAVGNANNKNKIAIVIPWHRVIGSNGKLVGYAGGLDSKCKLLELEKKHG